MSNLVTELTGLAQTGYYPGTKALLQYVRSGTDGDFQKLSKRKARYEFFHLHSAWEALPKWEEFTDEPHRFLRGVVRLGLVDDLMNWMRRRLEQQPGTDESALAVFLRAFGDGPDANATAAAWIMSAGDFPPVDADGTPNVWGRFLLSRTDDELRAAGLHAEYSIAALELFVREIPQRIRSFGASYLEFSDEQNRCLCGENCALLLDFDAALFELPVKEVVAKQRRIGRACLGLEILVRHFPDRYEPAMRAHTLKCLTVPAEQENDGDVTRAVDWLLTQYEASIVAELAPHFRNYHADSMIPLLKLAVHKLGASAVPLIVAAMEHPSESARFVVLQLLAALDLPEHDEAIRRGLEAALSLNSLQIPAIRFAAAWKLPLVAPELWKLLENKSKPVRVAAAQALAKLGEAAFEPAVKLLAAKKGAVRGAAVLLLTALATPPATGALEARVDEETDDEVRDQILLALDKVWESQNRRLDRAGVLQRVQRAADRLRSVPTWFDEAKCPALYFADGDAAALSRQTVRYLIYRQSRAKLMEADIEAKPLYALIDRRRSGEFAAFVLRGYLAGEKSADDRWAMALASLLGDDCLVPMLMQQIRDWVEAGRGKMAEYAAQALALLGTEAALCAVDALSIRYRSKQKNIGKAAAEAFAEAAERLGVTIDELGDRVVPWLGFESGKPRLIEADGKQIEVRIEADCKLGFRDVGKGKKISSLPAWVPADVKAEFKDLAATLREVFKGQTARMENLLVRQFRWPAQRWRELYLTHPVLFPFAARMLWAHYDDSGRRLSVFHALEDRSLTNERDETVALPGQGTVGLVHPLELTSDERQAWATHLSDYDVTAPVLQLERPVLFVKPEERGVKMSGRYERTELNAMTFKGRVERSGWQRGSVCDGGGITFYIKTYPGAGVDVLLTVEGMYIGIDMYSSIQLGKFYFVKGSSVRYGGYTYDEPSDEKDPRLLAFGDVPPIVYSETLGDLAKISGGKESADEAER